MIKTYYIGYTLVPNWAVPLLTIVLILGVIFVSILLIKDDN